MSDTFRRGFKTEASDIAREVRAELRLRHADRLDPLLLAEHLGIPVIPLSEYGSDAPQACAEFSGGEMFAFSAVTVFRGKRRIIVHNDYQPLGRQSNNIVHEASHGLLHHPPTPALDARGCRDWSKDIEDEASWLAGVLLIPEEAALFIASEGLSEDAAAERFGVSVQLVRWRMNMTGAHKRIARRRAAYARGR
ncbi:ImmA/IrrE family metallo-endopeptidase [Microbispora hainanensis]|uniref:ImmA/IrrE family metallo-endopeptidase n=1 Tax=Microbispora hainanensis TaxID=568844 RepID=UPI0033ED965D